MKVMQSKLLDLNKKSGILESFVSLSYSFVLLMYRLRLTIHWMLFFLVTRVLQGALKKIIWFKKKNKWNWELKWKVNSERTFVLHDEQDFVSGHTNPQTRGASLAWTTNVVNTSKNTLVNSTCKLVYVLKIIENSNMHTINEVFHRHSIHIKNDLSIKSDY